MGYSCAANADVTMRQIMAFSGCNSSNSWEGNNGFVYFTQIGRERADGAITGTVYKILKDGSGKRSGGFRIEPNGYVTRWPCLNNAMREHAHKINADVERFC